MTDLWEDNRMAAGAGNFFKFEAVGDEIAGTLESLRIHTFLGKQLPDGTVKPDSHCPVLLLDGTEVTASNVDLKDKLRAARPKVGDHVRIKFVAEVKNKHGGKSKLFDVTVTAGAPQQGDVAPF